MKFVVNYEKYLANINHPLSFKIHEFEDIFDNTNKKKCELKVMTNSLAHIAIAVENIENAKSLFELITGGIASENHQVESQKVSTSFINFGGTSIELLEPVGDDTPISKFLSQKGGGIHHLCIETDEFDNLIEKIKNTGVRILGDPFIGAKNKRVVFFHPKDTFNVLIELEEK